MNNRKNNPKLAPQLQQQPQKRNGINAAGNGHANAVTSPQRLLSPNVGQHALSQGMHGNMVPHSECGDRAPRLSARNAAPLLFCANPPLI
jgi:hypothetical protein